MRLPGCRFIRFFESYSTRPFNDIKPESGVSIPAMHFNVILFPEPDIPITDTTSSVSSMSTESMKLSNCFFIFTMSDIIFSLSLYALAFATYHIYRYKTCKRNRYDYYAPEARCGIITALDDHCYLL